MTANPSLVLRGGPSGPSFEPSTVGYVLTVQADGKSIAPEAVDAAAALNVARINAGNTGGTRLVDIDTSELVGGCLATVESVGAIFTLVTDAPDALTALVDGINVVSATVSSVWVRLKGPPNLKFAATPPLFVDPSLGSDDNDGLSPGAGALKTLDEWSRRMNGQLLDAPFTVSCAAGDVGNFGPCTLGEDNRTASVFCTLLGTSALSAESGTVTSVTAQNAATGQEFIFLDSSGAGPAIPDNSRLQIVSSATPANIGGTAFVKGFGPGGQSNPYTTVWTTTGGIPFYPSPGDTYVVSTPVTILRSVQSQWLNPYDAAPTVGGVAWTNFLLQGERFSQYQITSNELIGNGNFSSYFIQCVFDDSLGTNFARCNLRTYGCEFKQGVGVTFGAVSFHSACFRLGLAVSNSGVVLIDAGSAAFDGPSSLLNVSSSGLFTNSTDVCFSRLSSDLNFGALVQAGGRANVTGQWWTPPQGARNALRNGVVLFSGGVINTNFFALVDGLASSIFNVSNDQQIELVQFTVIENNQAAVTEASLGNGAIALQASLTTGAGGTIPAVSPTLGTERFTIGTGQYARSAGGALATVVAASSLATKTHAQLDSWQVLSPTVQTVGAATATLLQPNVANPGISGAIDNAAFYCEVVFIGYDAANGNAVSTKVSRTFKRVAGVLSALGAQHPLSPIDGDATLLAASVLLNATGNAIQAQATGVAGVTLNWTASFEIWSSEFVG